MIDIYSTLSIIYTRVLENDHWHSIFTKDICSYSISCIESVLEIGINTNVGMDAANAGSFIETFLEEIICIGVDLFGGFPNSHSVCQVSKKDHKIAVLLDTGKPISSSL